MGNIRTYSGKDLVTILKKLGFILVRQKGSHNFLEHEDGRRTVIPVHSNEDIGIGLFSKIMKDIEMTKEDFMKF